VLENNKNSIYLIKFEYVFPKIYISNYLEYLDEEILFTLSLQQMNSHSSHY
jgi:hypothetical protein